MDWAASDHKPPPRAEPAAPTLLEECWRLVGRSGKPIVCGIYVDGGPDVTSSSAWATARMTSCGRSAWQIHTWRGGSRRNGGSRRWRKGLRRLYERIQGGADAWRRRRARERGWHMDGVPGQFARPT